MDPLLYKLVWVFGWASVVLCVWYVRSSRKQRRLELIHAERMAAIAKGIPLPELPDYDDPGVKVSLAAERGGDPVNRRWPLGVGAVCIMAGIGLCLALRLSGDEYHNQIWPFGLIGVFVGAGLMLHYILTRPPSA
jgi:hypothetical protein